MYTPAKFTGGDKRSIGARARSYQASGGGFTASNSDKNRNKGKYELDSLISDFLRENQNNNNNEEEFELFRIERETRQLIESLESKNNGKNKA